MDRIEARLLVGKGAFGAFIAARRVGIKHRDASTDKDIYREFCIREIWI